LLIYNHIIDSKLAGTEKVVMKIRNVEHLMDDQDDGVAIVGVDKSKGCTDCAYGFMDGGLGVVAANVNGAVKVLNNQGIVPYHANVSVRVKVCHSFSEGLV
jgi:hypothetical protein